MQLFDNRILSRLSIFFMVLVLCMSCPVKREIKHRLGLATAAHVETGKSTDFSVCANYQKDNATRHTFQRAVGIPTVQPANTWSVLAVDVPERIPSAFSGRILPAIELSLFILYRKILI